MSLRTLTQTLDDIVSAAVLTFSAVAWTYAGFPQLEKVVAFGCLIAAIYGALRWVESRH